MSATSGTRRPSEYSSLEALPVTVSGDISFTVRILRAVDPSAPVVLILPAKVMKAKH
jgi:hypothetical protein